MMNPIVKQIVKTVPLVLGMIAVLFAWDFISKKLPESFMDSMDTMMNYGILAVVVVVGIGAVSFLYFNLFHEIYTQSILKRAHQLLVTVLDEKGEYLFVTVDCYQSGDESGPGFYIYRHYLFELKSGEKWLYKPEKVKREDRKALEYFNVLLKEPKEFKLNEIIHHRFEKEGYLVQIKPFKNKFDFGFQISCQREDAKEYLWKRKI